MSFLDAFDATVAAIRNDYGVEDIYDPTFDREFFLWDDMFSYDANNLPHPHFSVQETAKAFFTRSPWWLRWRYRDDSRPAFVLNGVSLVPKRTPTGNRYYTLADIERMAHAMADAEMINGERLVQILTLVLTQAAMYGVFRPKKRDGS